jgi:MFS family permease
MKLENLLNKGDILREKYNINKMTIMINLLFFMYFFLYDSFAITVPLYLTHIKLKAIYLGYILSISTIIRAFISAPIASVKKDKKLNILAITLLLNIVSIILVVIEFNKYATMLGFIIIYSTITVLNVIINPMIASNSPNEKLGITFGVRDVFLYAGSGIGLVVVGSLLKKTTYSNIFKLSILVFILMIILIKILNNIVFLNKKAEEKGKPENIEESICETTVKLRTFIYDRTFLYYCIFSVFISIASSALSYVPLLGKKYQIADSSIYYIFSSSIIISALLSVLSGIIIDKFDKKKLYVGYTFMYLLICVLLCINNKTLFITAVIINGIATGFANIAPTYFFNIFDERKAEKYWGLTSSVTLTTTSIANILWGFIWDIQYTYVLFSGVIFIFITFLLSFGLKNKRENYQ